MRRTDVRLTGALRAILGTVGYSPYRKFKAKPADYVTIAVVFVAALAMVAWALLG